MILKSTCVIAKVSRQEKQGLATSAALSRTQPQRWPSQGKAGSHGQSTLGDPAPEPQPHRAKAPPGCVPGIMRCCPCRQTGKGLQTWGHTMRIKRPFTLAETHTHTQHKLWSSRASFLWSSCQRLLALHPTQPLQAVSPCPVTWLRGSASFLSLPGTTGQHPHPGLASYIRGSFPTHHVATRSGKQPL